MTPIVFMGPSLPRVEAEELLDADFRPPVRRGDLASIEGCRTVVILDGEFDQNFPVSPKEILRLIDSGTTVIGAASMGALRAAELADLGMIGIGRIFAAYRSGRIEGDDEVALSYCPWSYEPRSVPLVNVRFWLDDLLAAGLIQPVERQLLFRSARRIFYAMRTAESLHEVISRCLGPDRVEQIAAAGLGRISNVKAEDAREALAFVSRIGVRIDRTKVRSL